MISCRANPIEEVSDMKKPVAGLTTYDQRQTGKYNVHVNIKDVQFFSLSDSIAGIGGDYGDYGDEGDYGEVLAGFGDTDTDYDASHLTVNPIFAFLGSKPTTAKPTTTTAVAEKLPSTSESPSSSISESNSNANKESATEKAATSTTVKQDSESEIKDSSVLMMKPAPTIDYEEIPVEVQYYRANQQKLPTNGRRAAGNRFHKRQPSVQIIGDGYGRTNNVKIMENDHQMVKICNRGEYRDNLGRCRVRTRRGAPGL